MIGVDLKKAAKLFANKFACGSSVAKNNQNQDEIVVQGDFSDELIELIITNWPHVSRRESAGGLLDLTTTGLTFG
jgi:density-regulated protein DRP1